VVHEALRELQVRVPRRPYQVVILHWLEGQPFDELAPRLGLTRKQAWDRHHRALAALRAPVTRAGRGECGRPCWNF
jgi:DNA-directed RNA polymerase specialized sigma24 family protein